MTLSFPGPRLARGSFFLALVLSAPLGAAPYRPASDDAVLERLPAGAPRGPAGAAPLDAAQAAAAARSYVDRARIDGDPRFLGYAEGVLRPWQDAPRPPAEVWLLRATLLQSRHRFAESLAELDRLLGVRPDHAQAWLTRATVLRVQGRFDEALAACAQLAGRTAPEIALLCAESVRGLSGGLPRAAATLDRLAPAFARAPPGLRLWHAAERAEMAERLGDDERALRAYRAALVDTGGDAGLRASLADLLLRLGRPREALAAAREGPPADVLKLRLALAARALGEPRADLETALRASFDAARRRGDVPHLREEALLALAVDADPARALQLAQDNWRVQREPADALTLAAAARRAGARDALAALGRWRARVGLQDARLGTLP